MNKLLIGTTAVALIISGCTTTPAPTRQPAESIALGVLNAAGLNQAQSDGAHLPSSEQHAEQIFGEDMPDDLRVLMKGGIRFISWIPARVAADEQEAQIRWGHHLETAAIEALPQGYTTQPFEWTDKSVSGEDSSYRVLRVNGPHCSEWSCILTGALVSREYSDISRVGQMQRVATPRVAGHEEAESYTQSGVTSLSLQRVNSEFLEVGQGQGRWYRINTTLVKEFDHNAFYQRLSAALQSWNFIYAAPENPAYNTSVPLVLNQGNELYFPESGLR